MFIILVLALLSSCGSSSKPGASQSGKAGSSSSGETQSHAEPREEGRKMNGPDIPPEGIPYDEWKNIEYSTDTIYDVSTYWVGTMSNHTLASDNGFFLDPEVLPAKLEIVDVKAEPVGGEMKLRSGGYVDITVKTVWTGRFQYYHVGTSESAVWFSFIWESNSILPYDSYSGTSLLNYSEGEDGKSISVGEATDSGFVESFVTWNGRTFRLFAKSDHRNLGGEAVSTEESDGKTVVKRIQMVEDIYTFRIPADYDGLALCIDKDIFDEKPFRLSEYGDILPYDDLNADILTDDRGGKHSPDEFYFVKVSDLIKLFENR